MSVDKHANVGVTGTLRLTETGEQLTLSFGPKETKKHIRIELDNQVIDTYLVLHTVKVAEGLCPFELRIGEPVVVKEVLAAAVDAKPEAPGTEPEPPVVPAYEEPVQANIPLTQAPPVPVPDAPVPPPVRGRHARKH